MQGIRDYIKLVLTELGRNYHTVNDPQYTYRSFSDYEVIINPVGNSRYSLYIEFKGKKIGEQKIFKDYEEAENNARIQIDNHRVAAMNKS